MWTMLEAMEWAHLPYGGGLMDQPEELMENVAIISWLAGIIRDQTYR